MIDYDMLMKEEWYAQGLNSTPFLIVTCGLSAFDLTEAIGDKFNNIIYEFKQDYGKMYYPKKGLERLGNVIVDKIKADVNFLKDLKIRYEQQNKECIEKLDASIKNLAKLSDEELLTVLKQTKMLLRKSVGYAHIIEPFALSTDMKLKNMLSSYCGDEKKVNSYLSILSTPIEKSFVNESEEMLYQISIMEDGEDKNLKIEEYIKRFFWIKNTYSGRVIITPEMVKEELKSIKQPKPFDGEEIKKKQNELIEELGLDEDLVYLISASNFITIWQDQRKILILTALDHADRVLEEISNRTGIDIKLLRYLSATGKEDVFNDSNLKDVLEERRKGCVVMTTPDEEIILTGDDYVKFHKDIDQTEKKNIDETDFRGMTASTGVGIGPARVCVSMDDINNFQEGEVLVASMTRPEFTPAMKKAVAIVTDEGGITSHAAIVSRELGVPCVIGTKVATKVIKNGDSIEVKANHGLVKILERAE